MTTESAEFLHEGVIPFSLASCEPLVEQSIPGYYDEQEQVWKGAEDLPLAAAQTATATVPNDTDTD